MDTLPKGITGFWKHHKPSYFSRLFKTKEKPIPQVNIQSITKVINRLESKFKTVTLTPEQVDNNFYLISIFSETDLFYVAINNTHPYYCGIENTGDWTTVIFCDLPHQVTSILNTEFIELSQAYLQQDVTPQHLQSLGPIEIEQITYWKTKKVGNIIFNKYD